MAVVGANIPGIRDIIQHGQNGLLCQPDPAGISQAIRQLLEDDVLRETLGANARRFANDKYALDKIADLELAKIMEVLNTD